jgi:hypothetical protein
MSAELTGHEILSSIATVPAGFLAAPMALGCEAHEANNRIFDPFQTIFHNDLKA